MDNYGIFKLLSRFYDYYKKNGDKFSPDNLSAPATDKTRTDGVKPADADRETTGDKTGMPPLNKNMVLTMKTHDEIVKRVLNNKHP